MEPTRQSRLIRTMRCPACGRVLRETRETVTCKCEAQLLNADGKVTVLTHTEAESLRINALLYGLEP